MSIFGPDISSYQAGLDLSRLGSASFVLAKTTEGTYYTDANYQGWRQQAAGLGRPFVWYHFLSGEDPGTQARHTRDNVGDIGLPGMLDAEPAGSFSPSLAQMIAYIDAAHGAGLNLRLLYLPRWYWEQIGSPDLGAIRDRGVQLGSSAYPGGSGSPAGLYPGDGAAGWQAYGGMTPLLYQYTDRATDGGQSLDYNAYRGSVDQLRASLQAPVTTPAPTPDPPTSTPMEDDNMPAFVTGDIKAGAGAKTVICVPPADFGSAGWGKVWFSLGSAWGDAHVEVGVFLPGQGWQQLSNDFVVPDNGNRVNPVGGPLPQAAQKIAIRRKDQGANAELSYLIEAAAR